MQGHCSNQKEKLAQFECACLFDPMGTEPGGRLLRRDDWHRGAADAQRHLERHHPPPPLLSGRVFYPRYMHTAHRWVVVAITAWLPLLQGIHFLLFGIW
jgi:hypothetical protein